MRILFTTGSAPGYMAPPTLSSAQVNCGPDWLDAKIDGRVVSLATPVGEYDLDHLARQLPPEQKPEAVVCLVDSTLRSVPRKLKAFRCPKVLLVADTHHLVAPLQRIIRYAQSEPFDRIVLLYARHHWEFFQEAGVQNLYWFPGLTFPHHDEDVAAARNSERARQAAFVGQIGICHPRRVHLLSQFGAHGLPLTVKEIPQREALALYGRSLLGINVSLNGDLNLRVLEILSSGAMLLTDELSHSSGISELRAAGCELTTYASAEEMVERAQWAMAHPGEAQTIGQTGARWFDRYFNAKVRRQLFEDLALHGAVPEPFTLPQPPSVRVRPVPEFHWQLLVGFECVQELHRNLEQVTVAIDSTVPERFAGMCRTLPRIALRPFPLQPAEEVTFLALGRTNASTDLRGATQVWFWDATAADRQVLDDHCTSQGLAPANPNSFLFCRRLINTHGNFGSNAMVQLEQGNYQGALALAKLELEANPLSVEGLLTMLDLAEETANAGAVQKFFTQLARTAPHHPRFVQMQVAAKSGRSGRRLPERLGRQARACVQVRRWTDAEGLAVRALKLDPKCAEAHTSLGLALEARGVIGAALHHLGQATVSAPTNPEHWFELGMALHRHGRAQDALAAMLQAAETGATRLEIQLGLAGCALTAGYGRIAAEALAVVERILPGHPLVQKWGRKARDLAAVADHSTPRDLLISHVEVCRLQGSGVLLQRFFPKAKGFITVRSRTLYNGKVDLGGKHLSLDLPGLSFEARRRVLRRLLEPYRIQRILAVPFFATDFQHAMIAKELTGAPLCTYVMDDQTLHSPEVPASLAEQVFAASELRLAISPELAVAYAARFDCPFGLLPPIVTDRNVEAANEWNPSLRPKTDCALVGNIWSAGQFERVRALIRSAGLKVDWFGNADVSWLPQDREALAREGLNCRGFVPERQLARELSRYPFAIVPSGALDGTEDNEWLTRLSLPSRMVFIVAQTFTPMLVLGSPETAAARFVRRLGVGTSSPYESGQALEKILEITDPTVRRRLVENARRAAECFLMPEAGEWIWRSLALGRPEPAPFDGLFQLGSSDDAVATGEHETPVTSVTA